MDQESDEPGRIASDYVRKHGREALIYVEGDIAKALGTSRWDEYKLLHRVRLRLRRLQLFDQAAQRSGGGIGAGPHRLAGQC